MAEKVWFAECHRQPKWPLLYPMDSGKLLEVLLSEGDICPLAQSKSPASRTGHLMSVQVKLLEETWEARVEFLGIASCEGSLCQLHPYLGHSLPHSALSLPFSYPEPPSSHLPATISIYPHRGVVITFSLPAARASSVALSGWYRTSLSPPLSQRVLQMHLNVAHLLQPAPAGPWWVHGRSDVPTREALIDISPNMPHQPFLGLLVTSHLEQNWRVIFNLDLSRCSSFIPFCTISLAEKTPAVG